MEFGTRHLKDLCAHTGSLTPESGTVEHSVTNWQVLKQLEQGFTWKGKRLKQGHCYFGNHWKPLLFSTRDSKDGRPHLGHVTLWVSHRPLQVDAPRISRNSSRLFLINLIPIWNTTILFGSPSGLPLLLTTRNPRDPLDPWDPPRIWPSRLGRRRGASSSTKRERSTCPVRWPWLPRAAGINHDDFGIILFFIPSVYQPWLV